MSAGLRNRIVAKLINALMPKRKFQDFGSKIDMKAVTVQTVKIADMPLMIREFSRKILLFCLAI